MWNQFNKIFATWIASLILTFGMTVDAQGDGNLLLNGDFEDHPLMGDLYDLDNVQFTMAMNNVTGFGEEEGLDILTGPEPFGQDPQSGNWNIAAFGSENGMTEAFSFLLAGQMFQGHLYYVEFYMQQMTDPSFGTGGVEIGISNFPTNFGTEIFHSRDATFGWTRYGTSFVAPFTSGFLTVRLDDNDNHWVGLDNFNLRRLILGDVNQDGSVDLLDVAPFVEVFTSKSFQAEADVNRDGVVNLLDVQPFVDRLTD